MRQFTATCVLLILFCGASGQTSRRLISAIEEAGQDSLKIAAYHELINHYRYRNRDSALLYTRQALTYAREHGSLMGEASMTNVLGQLNERHGELEAANGLYTEARTLFQKAGHTKGVASTTNGLGVVAGRTGKYNEATRHFLEALELFEKIQDTAGVVQTYIKLGVVSDNLGNLEEALSYYLKAEELNRDPGSPDASLTLLNNIGIIYGKRNDLLTALKYFHKGLRQSDPHASTGIHISLLGSLGLAYQKIGKLDSARHYQERALLLARENQLPEEEARSLVNLAALVETSDPSQSLTLLNEARDIAERIRQMKLLTEIYESLIGLYKDKEDFKQALLLSEKRQLIHDSLFSLEKSKEIANLHATHEVARKETEIKELALRNEKSVFQRNLMIAVAMAAIAVICIVWFYSTRISNLNTLLMRKQMELRNSNTIKDKLFSVLGHDLRAPLTRVIGLLNVLSSKHQNQEEKIVIERLTHQSLTTLETLDNLLMWGHSQLKGILLNQQIIPAKEQIRKTIVLSSDYAAQKNVRLVDNVPPELYVHADPSHFDFIVRNLLSNALKFSHSGGTVSINATSSPGDQVVFSIADSGIGIPADVQEKLFLSNQESVKGTWNEKGTGIGLLLCKEYVIENGGKLWLESKEGKGATFYFSMRQKHFSRQQVLFPEAV